MLSKHHLMQINLLKMCCFILVLNQICTISEILLFCCKSRTGKTQNLSDNKKYTVLSVTKYRGLPNFQWFAKLEYVFPLALREMNNFMEFLEPWYFTIPDESQIRAQSVGKRGVSDSVMFLTPVTRRVMTSHALGTLIAVCQRILRVWYLRHRYILS